MPSRFSTGPQTVKRPLTLTERLLGIDPNEPWDARDDMPLDPSYRAPVSLQACTRPRLAA